MTKISILIVDDDLKWCQILSAQLQNYSFFNVQEPITDGELALKIIQETKPDVIVLDLLMPKVDGFYIINQVRENMLNYHPYIYVISAMGTVKTREILNNLDVDYFSIKPINTSIVADNLYRLLLKSTLFKRLFPPSVAANDLRDDCRVFSYPQVYELDQFIDDYLYGIGAPTSSLSTKCAKEAIRYCICHDAESVKIMAVYKAVSRELGRSMTHYACERNIRTVVKKVSDTPNLFFANVFSNMSKLTNSEFIFRSAKTVLKIVKENVGDNAFIQDDGKIHRS